MARNEPRPLGGPNSGIVSRCASHFISLRMGEEKMGRLYLRTGRPTLADASLVLRRLAPTAARLGWHLWLSWPLPEAFVARSTHNGVRASNSNSFFWQTPPLL